MTVKSLYYCNICGNRLSVQVNDNFQRGIGIDWLNGGKAQASAVSNSVHHICCRCLNAIHSLGEEAFNQKISEACRAETQA